MSEIADEIRKALKAYKLSMWDLQSNAPTWLRWQQDEIERLQNKIKQDTYDWNRTLIGARENATGWRELAESRESQLQQLREELAEEKRHATLGWEQSNKWLEENGRLRAELDQIKKERDTYRQEAMNERELGESIVAEREELYIELEAKDKILEEAHDIIDSIPKGGSKEGRPDYGTMVTSDKIYRLRSILSHFKKGDTKDAANHPQES